MTAIQQMVATALVLVGTGAQSAVKSKVVDYKQGDTPLQGFLAWNDAAKRKQPGIIVVHEWWGHDQHARNQALKLAKEGYVAFALDLFGKGKLATHPNDARAFVAEAMKDPKMTDARFKAAVDVLAQDSHVDNTKLGAIGYCFGGGMVLNEVRQGADFKAVAIFHGSLKATTPAKPGSIRPEILVMTGGADPSIPPEQVETFKKEMTEAGAKFEVITYPGAKHAFTNPDADKHGMPALGYNAEADKKSWNEMLRMFKRVFGGQSS